MLADLAARFCAALRADGLAVGADRAARFTRALAVASPERLSQVYWCALATLTSAPGDADIVRRVFDRVFLGVPEPPPAAAAATPDTVPGTAQAPTAPPPPSAPVVVPPVPGGGSAREGREGAGDAREVETPTLGSAAERLSARDFADLDAAELALLADAMRRFRIATPPRRTRRHRAGAVGRGVDMRDTLRRARRTGADPVRLRRRVARWKPRKLVVLCDISGSMQAHARAMVQLLVSAAGGAHAEVFTFATRLTRLTHLLAADPVTALREAGRAAPDWSGGTRIGANLRAFLDTYGARGAARGAVVVVVSDGWEAGDARELGEQMARLSRLAYRVVWVNPRTAKPGYRPLAAGMAAAWPFCDTVVSAHRLDAVDEVIGAIAGHRR